MQLARRTGDNVTNTGSYELQYGVAMVRFQFTRGRGFSDPSLTTKRSPSTESQHTTPQWNYGLVYNRLSYEVVITREVDTVVETRISNFGLIKRRT